MGFELSGCNPSSSEGEYFRANVWAWRPIVSLIEDTGVLSADELVSISFNDGFCISEEQALAIADALESKLVVFPDEYEMPSDCRVNDDGTFLPPGASGGRSAYSIEKDHLREFVGFCRSCGGFEVY